MSPSINLKKSLKVAEEAARKAGGFLTENQDKVEVLKFKEREDILTNIDLEAEKIIIEAISKEFPKHNIHSEEAGIINNHSEYTWVIDPLDGTKEYYRGLPYYSSCIACEKKDEILLACVFIPEANELFSAAKGFGAYKNGKTKLQVSEQERLSHAIIAAHPPNYKVKEPEFTQTWQILARMAKSSFRLRPTAYDNIILCYLAKGGFDGYFVLFEEGPQWWDIAPGLLIVQEAGGKVTNRHNQKIKNESLKGGIVASNGRIHQQLIKILST